MVRPQPFHYPDPIWIVGDMPDAAELIYAPVLGSNVPCFVALDVVDMDFVR